MDVKPVLSLVHCRQMVTAAEDAAELLGCKVSIAMADDGGHPLFLVRLDGASPMSAHVAPAKARMAAIARRDTKLLEDMVNSGRFALLSSPVLDGSIEGGVPVLLDGVCLGAIGVSGARPEHDTQIAKAAVAALIV